MSQQQKILSSKRDHSDKSMNKVPEREQSRIFKSIERKRDQRTHFKLQVSEKMTAQEILIFEKCKETKVFAENCFNKLLQRFKDISEIDFNFGTKKKKNLALFLNYYLTISIKSDFIIL